MSVEESLIPHVGYSLPPAPLEEKKKKTNSSVSGGVLFGCSLAVGCSCVLLRLFGFTLSLPKVASHGDDVGDVLAQVAIDPSHCVKAQLDLSTP